MSEEKGNTQIKLFEKIALILLCLNTLFWTVASFFVYSFFGNETAGRVRSIGTNELWPFTRRKFDWAFSIEEWCFFVLVPWVVFYFLKKKN